MRRGVVAAFVVGGLLLLTGAVINPSITLQSLIFLASGTGATPRPVMSKLRDVVSVCDFIGSTCPSATASVNAAGIQQCLTNAKAASGGTCYVPAGTYNVDSQLSLSAATGVRLLGESASTQATGGSVIQYTGTSTPFLSFSACASVKIDTLSIRYTSASFTGTLVAFPTSADVSVNNSGFLGNGQSGALYLVSLDTATDVGISDSVFDNSQYAILGQASAGGGYANGVSIRRSRFGSGITVGDIRDPGQGWDISGSVFENIANGKGQAIKMSDSQSALGLTISGSWFGDATENSTAWAWIEFLGEGLVVQGNYIHGTGTPTATGIKIMGTSYGISVSGNHIGALSKGVDAQAGLVDQFNMMGNRFPSTTTPFSGTPANMALIQSPAGSVAFDVWGNGALQMRILNTGAVSLTSTLSAGTITAANGITQTGGDMTLKSVLQAALGTPANGTVVFCSDCTTASACTAGGTGALASRQAGAWKCL